jgi:hypothetical protein
LDKFGISQKNITEYNKNSNEDACVGANHEVGKYTPVIGVDICNQSASSIFFKP